MRKILYSLFMVAFLATSATVVANDDVKEGCCKAKTECCENCPNKGKDECCKDKCTKDECCKDKCTKKEKGECCKEKKDSTDCAVKSETSEETKSCGKK